ncbi:MAG: DUF6438 domain-containing protein [Bacteroidota bacterium]
MDTRHRNNLKIISALLLIVTVAATVSCKTRRSNSATVGATATEGTTGALHPDSIFAAIERSPCFGRCPVFKATIYNNGKAVYIGRTSVSKLGMFTASVTADQLKSLSQKATELRLDTLQNQYVNEHLADFPSHQIKILTGNILKSVYVMDTDPPSSIIEFEKTLEELLDQLTWTKVSQKDE